MQRLHRNTFRSMNMPVNTFNKVQQQNERFNVGWAGTKQFTYVTFIAIA